MGGRGAMRGMSKSPNRPTAGSGVMNRAMNANRAAPRPAVPMPQGGTGAGNMARGAANRGMSAAGRVMGAMRNRAAPQGFKNGGPVKKCRASRS